MTAKKPYSPGYFEITMHQFGKNKLAVGGIVIILLLFAVACFAPLIANEKPLAVRGSFPEKYEDIFYALCSNASIYMNAHKAVSENQSDDLLRLRKYREYTFRSFNRLRPYIPADIRGSYLEYRQNILAEIDKKNYDAARSYIEQFENTFLLDDSDIEPITLFPALSNLSALEMFFMLFYPLILFLILKNLFRGSSRPLKVKKGFIVCFLMAFFGAILWNILNPTVFDPTNYKRIVNDTSICHWAIFAPVPYGENENLISEASAKPTWLMPKDQRTDNYHVLGTDTNGRDVLTRMIMGTRISMSVGFIAVGICLFIGIFFGAIAGYFRGKTDLLISRLIEIVICFPVFFLILTVLAFLRPSIVNIMVVIGITGWTGIARLCRGEFLKLVNQDFVTAAQALGASNLRTIFKHILPNGMGPILVSVSFGIAGAILTESALSFLGFGVPQPTASWGDLLNNGRSDIQGTWWLTMFPGLAIFIAVTAFNLAGEGLRDALDPRLKKQ
ncbi:MAG: ABC transporter permease [Candidatus Auribacterota bacterium]|jgi:peptide/nickel transport system permease protein|nr:ABC transporter permease [Candidatus Auribacterota bacterium]